MAELQDEQPKNPEQRNRKPLRIIHIEDQKQFRDLIGMELKKFTDIELVASFGSTEEAEEYLIRLKNEKKDLPDMIVSDNSLGVGQRRGMQFAKDIKKLGFEIPVVLFTSDAEQFKHFSQEQLEGIGLKSVVDKSGFESTGDLVSILESIKPAPHIRKNFFRRRVKSMGEKDSIF